MCSCEQLCGCGVISVVLTSLPSCTLHRLEKDAVDWARVLGGLPKYLGEYAKSFAAAGFSQQRDIYIASGLLSYNASAEMKQMLEFLAPYARTVRYKEMYLPPELLNGLNPEQEALVDFLVIANADSFVGLGSSTFSVYLRWVMCWVMAGALLAVSVAA